MMRISLTRSVTRVVLLASCLLIGLACVTRFPIENLEEGMTAETGGCPKRCDLER